MNRISGKRHKEQATENTESTELGFQFGFDRLRSFGYVQDAHWSKLTFWVVYGLKMKGEK